MLQFKGEKKNEKNQKQNSKHKIPNTNKGITLIALVITIIVMLILVAVTISMAVNGGLFDYAGMATGDTQNVINQEQELANLEANMAVNDRISKYTQNSGETDVVVTFILDGVEFTADEGTTWKDWLRTVDTNKLGNGEVVNFIESSDEFGDEEDLYISIGPPIGGGSGIREVTTRERVIAGGLIANGGEYEYFDDAF